MTKASSEMTWQRPLTPWRVVQQRFFAEHGLDAAAFSAKYELNENDVRMVLGEVQTTLFPDLCDALAAETGTTPAFFSNLSEQYHRNVAV